jgi:hypothetical protein
MTNPQDRAALDRIAALLDGREWDASDLDEIAAIVAATGRRVRDPSDVEGDEMDEDDAVTR